MNRFSTLQSLANKQRENPANTLSKYVRRDIKTATPISHSIGRGYGLLAGVPLSLSTHAHNNYLPNTITRGLTAANKPKSKVEKAMEEANMKPSNLKMGPLKEELDDIREDLVKLTEKEIATITEEDENSIQTQRGKNWLDQSGYILQDVADDKEMLMLTKQIGNTSVIVTFSKDIEENEDDEENLKAVEEGGEEADEAATADETADQVAKSEEAEGSENWVRSGDELPDRQGLPPKHSLEIDVRINDKEAKPKGQIHMYGFAGLDDRMYVNEMLCNVGPPKPEPPKGKEDEDEDEGDENMVIFDDLSKSMQDRIYDYLDELGVDDRMAHFIKITVARERKESDITFLNDFKEILKP